MPSALIVATRRKVHPEAVAVGRALALLGSYDVSYLNAKFSVRSSLPTDAIAPNDAPVFRDRIKKSVVGMLPLRALALLRGIVADRRRVRPVLATTSPDLVVLFDDRSPRPDLVIRGMAAKRKVPVIVVPFAISSIEGDALMRHGKIEHRIDAGAGRWLKQWVARRWPNQVQDGLLFFNAFDTLALAVGGILPPKPWVQGGSGVDAVCASGVDEHRYLINGGIDPDRVAMIGQPSLDEISMSPQRRYELKAELVERYRLNAGRPIVICAVPQDAEHNLVDWDRHRQLTERLFASLAHSGAAILLSLHPRSDRRNYEALATQYGLSIIDEPLTKVIAAADLLVGTFSSTIRWAIGLGIPAFVIDALGLQLNLYRGLDGVTIFDDHGALAAELARFTDDPDARHGLAAAAERGALRAGRVDGQASFRLMETVSRIVVANVANESATVLTKCPETVT